MKRSTPLARRTPLQAKTELARGQSTLTRTGRFKPRSAKTARLYVTRRALVAELFADPVVCEVPWCPSIATDPHEPLTRARGGSVVDRANIRLICAEHHRQIHDEEPDWAYLHGFLIHSWGAA